MSLNSALREWLLETASINTLIGDRAHPIQVPEGSVMPVVTYREIASTRAQSHNGPSGLAFPLVQIDCWSDTMLGAETLKEAVRIALDGFKGSMGSTVALDVQAVQLARTRDDYEANTKRYRKTMDFEFQHAEVTS